jgi:hypothetical protein
MAVKWDKGLQDTSLDENLIWKSCLSIAEILALARYILCLIYQRLRSIFSLAILQVLKA